MKPGSGTVVRQPVGAAASGIVGKPSAAFVGSTSSRSFFGPRSVGYMLAGGVTPFITQLRKCTRIAFTVCACGSGFAARMPVPKLLPGQPGPAPVDPMRLALIGLATLEPPCVVLAM